MGTPVGYEPVVGHLLEDHREGLDAETVLIRHGNDFTDIIIGCTKLLLQGLDTPLHRHVGISLESLLPLGFDLLLQFVDAPFERIVELWRLRCLSRLLVPQVLLLKNPQRGRRISLQRPLEAESILRFLTLGRNLLRLTGVISLSAVPTQRFCDRDLDLLTGNLDPDEPVLRVIDFQILSGGRFGLLSPFGSALDLPGLTGIYRFTFCLF
jgi:hypothetical protein